MARGPMYDEVELLDVLPMRPSQPDGMKQQLPSREDLRAIIQRHPRIVAGYEVLLAHYLRLRAAAVDVAEHWTAWLDQEGWDNDEWDGFSDSLCRLERLAKSVSVPCQESETVPA